MASRVIEIVPMQAPLGRQMVAARDDLVAAWQQRRIWATYALRVAGNRYRRSVLGPWWQTLSTLIFVFGLAVLRSGLGGGDMREAIPYVGLGYVAFGLASGGITAGMNAYIGAGAELSTSRAPYSGYVLRAVAVEVIDFLHDAVAVLLIAAVFAMMIQPAWLWSLLAVVLIVASSVGVGLWLGPLAARYRDVPPLVSSVLRLMFLLTPIFWSIDNLAANDRSWLAWWNPFTYQVLAFRDPILGTMHHGLPMALTAGLAVVNLAVGLCAFTLCRARIPYWVLP